MAKIDDAQWIQLVESECKGKEKRPYKPDLGFTHSTFKALKAIRKPLHLALTQQD